ncbi:MAG: hypothetical protein ACI835_003194 [Planctomycetota bacterium]|jgi:hypothetical protein
MLVAPLDLKERGFAEQRTRILKQGQKLCPPYPSRSYCKSP